MTKTKHCGFKVRRRALRMINSIVFLLAVFSLVFGVYFRVNPDKTPPADSERKSIVNQSIALMITHAVFLMVCSLMGVLASFKTRLLIATFYITFLMFMVTCQIILAVLSQTNLKKSMETFAKSDDIIKLERCQTLTKAECKDLIVRLTQRISRTLLATTVIAMALNVFAVIIVYGLIGLTTKEEMFPIDNTYLTPAAAAVQFGKAPAIVIQEPTPTTSEIGSIKKQKTSRRYNLHKHSPKTGSPVVVVEHHNNHSDSRGVKRKQRDGDRLILQPRAIHFSTISSDVSMTVTPAKKKQSPPKVISTKAKKTSPSGKRSKRLERPGVPLEKSLSPVKNLIRRVSSQQLAEKNDTPKKCSFCGAYRRSILKKKRGVNLNVQPPSKRTRRGSVTWMDNTSPVPDTQRCCIQCGKITPEMQRRNSKFSLPRTPRDRQGTYRVGSAMSGHENPGFSPGSDGMQSPRSDGSVVDDVFSPQRDEASDCSDYEYSTPGNTINYAYIQSPSQLRQENQSAASKLSKSGSEKSAGSTPYRLIHNSAIETFKAFEAGVVAGSGTSGSYRTPASKNSTEFVSASASGELYSSPYIDGERESSFVPLSSKYIPGYRNSSDTLTSL